MTSSAPTHTILLRVPPALYKHLHAHKQRSGQSMNSTAVAILEDFFDRQEADAAIVNRKVT